MWVRKCLLYYMQKCQGQIVNVRHKLEAYNDQQQELVVDKAKALQGIKFEQFVGYYDCRVVQQICRQQEDIQEERRRFRQVEGRICQYEEVVQPVITAIIVTGLLEVVEEKIYAKMKAQRIQGAEEKLDKDKIKAVLQAIIKQFTQKVNQRSIKASVLLQGFYQLTIRLEDQIKRNQSQYQI